MALLGGWCGLRGGAPTPGAIPDPGPDPLADVDLRGVGPFVWHPSYDCAFRDDPFYAKTVRQNPTPFEKYGLLRSTLISEGLAAGSFFQAPEVGESFFATAHSRLYLDTLRTLAHCQVGRLYGENMIVPGQLRFLWACGGGTYAAARIALERGVAMNLAGGFHHAFPRRFEGLCHLNDTAATIRCLRAWGHGRRFLIVDLDVHQGNGNAHVFFDDPEVAIVDLYQSDNYPGPAFVPTDYAVGLDASAETVDDDRYLQELDVIGRAIEAHRPDLMFLIAGVDPWQHDRLGGFQVTREGLVARDRIALDAALSRGTPVVATLAGGYGASPMDGGLVAELHAQTARELLARA